MDIDTDIDTDIDVDRDRDLSWIADDSDYSIN